MVAIARQYDALPLWLPYAWSRGWGEDAYGIWTEFEVNGVAQRMRWIPPGEFLMGSPKGEPERFSDEVQHEVVLTQGFWLADTTCTQALWEAVMGKNASRFKGAKRPVENVSFEDCERFLGQINQLRSGLEVRLPTEAQWEYACRAGTTTPFSFGETITAEQVNYDGNYSYQGGETGKYREETVDVKTLPANHWGLYEMHGNVWEWCSDWKRTYEEGRVVDPVGPETGDERVLRGGSWFHYAGYCRSASRVANPPGFRRVYIGFRLSRGQVCEVQAEKPRGAGPTEAERSGDGADMRNKRLFSRIRNRFRKKT